MLEFVALAGFLLRPVIRKHLCASWGSRRCRGDEGKEFVKVWRSREISCSGDWTWLRCVEAKVGVKGALYLRHDP